MNKTNFTKILIVDDEPAIRKIFKSILEKEYYDIDEASNGIECLEKLQVKNYNIVFLDLKMPHKDGIETLAEIRKTFPNLAVVMVSANSDVRIAVKCIHQGARDYMLKPFDLEQLHENLEKAIIGVLNTNKEIFSMT